MPCKFVPRKYLQVQLPVRRKGKAHFTSFVDQSHNSSMGGKITLLKNQQDLKSVCADVPKRM